jgi:Ni/Fe-hydrogenase subunit HybB-like protein
MTDGKGISFRITGFRLVLMLFALLFVGTFIYRLIFGLSFTNMSDAWPWGIWTVLDIKLGIALAAGGFTTAGIYYVLGVKKIESITRPALLTAWLGYSMVALGLFIDLGRWYAFWHPIFWWGVHSVMFELFICVLLYTIVLTLEFAPVLFHGVGLLKVAKALTAMTAPLVIIGIVLSTMHQSSLGSMYVLMAGKLDGLWWTMVLPLLYFLSAVAVGPAVVACESALSGKTYGHTWDDEAMPFLAKWSGYVLSIYFVMRVVDLIIRGQVPRLFSLNAESVFCLIELVVGSVVPLLFFWGYNLSGKFMDKPMIVRNSVFIIAGVIINRANVVLTGMTRQAGVFYYPSLGEVFITLGIISTGILAYLFIAENFDVFSGHHDLEDEETAKKPSMQAAT